MRQRLIDAAKDWLPPVIAQQLRRLTRPVAITFEGLNVYSGAHVQWLRQSTDSR